MPKQNQEKAKGTRGMELIGVNSVQEVVKRLF
jgi:hypothetical protein